MKIRVRKQQAARGSIQKVRESDLGSGLRLEVHKYTPPQDPEILASMQRARQLVEQGSGERAAALAYEVWQRGQGDKFVEVWAGQMLAKHGAPERAVEVYCASEDLEPGSWVAYWHLGLFLLSCEEAARAAVFLEEAVRIESRAIDAHLDLARCLKKLGRAAEAARHLELARQLG